MLLARDMQKICKGEILHKKSERTGHRETGDGETKAAVALRTDTAM
jgi:hypothetical protein